MAYTPQTWADGDPTTPLSAARLLHLETQYASAIAEVVAEINNASSIIYGALDSHFATNAEMASVVATQFFNYGVRPIVRYSGTAWPSRASSIPTGYTGNVDYDSADFTAVPSPSDMVANDRWIRQTT